MNITPKQFNEFVKQLQYHDWYYDYSDDGRVWRAGRAADQALKAEAQTHPILAQAHAAYSAYYFRKEGTADAGAKQAKHEMQVKIDELRKQVEASTSDNNFDATVPAPVHPALSMMRPQ